MADELEEIEVTAKKKDVDPTKPNESFKERAEKEAEEELKKLEDKAEQKVDDLVEDVAGVDLEEIDDTLDKAKDAFDALPNLANAIGNCSGLGDKFKELADTIDELSDAFDELVDKLTDKITNALALPAIEIKWKAEYALLMAGMRKDFAAITDYFAGANLPFSDDLKNLAALGVETFEFVQEVNRLKDKYGNESAMIDEILDDPAGFINGLAGDIDKLCAAMPSFEKGKDGKLKVRINPSALDLEISIREIIQEGASPTLKRIEDALKETLGTVELVHEEYPPVDSKGDKLRDGGL